MTKAIFSVIILAAFIAYGYCVVLGLPKDLDSEFHEFALEEELQLLTDVGPSGVIDGSAPCRRTTNNAFRTLNIAAPACIGRNCTLNYNVLYNGQLTFRANATLTNVTVEVRLPRGAGNNTVRTSNFRNNTEYTLPFNVLFDSRFSNEKNQSKHTVQVAITINNSTVALVCREFTINLNVPRSGGGSWNTTCYPDGQPCEFPWSSCMKGRCGCQSTAFLEDNTSCKQKVGSVCTSAADCLKDGACLSTSNRCSCKNGYKPSDGEKKCVKGEALTYSLPVVILLIQQAFVFFSNKF